MPGSSASKSRLKTLGELLGQVLQLQSPADVVISRFFREHPKLGIRDRAFLSEAAWSVLRHRTLMTHLASAGAGPMNRRFALLASMQSVPLQELSGVISPEEKDWLTHVQTLSNIQLPPTTRFSTPEWIFDAWVSSVGNEEAIECAQSSNQSAPLDLRVNTLKATPEEVIESLAKEGVIAKQSDVLPEALRLENKPALQRTEAFGKGLFEVQDLGSQLLARLLAVRRGQFVVDLCAGAGGKTLALGALMRNTGRLYALDVSVSRLSKLKPRLIKSGLSNVWPSGISGLKDERLKRLTAKADAVLVDAPCSGTGTFRRNPDLKWRQTKETLASLIAKQSEILGAAARLLKPGGRLVYATCSLLDDENQALVEAFLAQNPTFTRVSCQQVLAEQRVVLPAQWRAFTAAGDLWLWPHRSGTDGFFAATLQKAG